MSTCPAALSELPDQRNSGRLMLRSINHISKVCSNVEASVAFYREVLGFILIKRPTTFNNTFEGAWLWGYGMGLHLIKGTPVPRSKQIDPKSDHLSFQADSLDEVEAQLRARGVPYCRQTVVEDGLEVNQCFFLDCDNNMIEVCNCDCLPVIPLEQVCVPKACSIEKEAWDEDTTSRDSMDSSRSDFEHEPQSAHLHTAAFALAAAPVPPCT
ncbi:hypothetical protein D9Q98_000733 [Chlorella vulgaris]|uniref:VOC domain-containing protein n=1 Tax=Chlorella vulgaris TaxID=3077 RepID=A0A9D4TZP8_CHLVU|nr:hypothetical protein D9Q98_000733 [Chlorella vulgaris]